MSRPLFIVLEGIDGAGTTTQATRLVAALEARGRRAVETREPSRGPIGRLLREILLGGHRVGDATAAGTTIDGRTMALLFAADRVDHLQREVEPQLAAGTDVVSDRYLLSSLAYQAEEADRAWVASLARDVRVPDLTLLLDLPVEVAAERRRVAGRPVERYDADELLGRVASHYRRLIDEVPNGRVIDATGTVDQVTNAIVRAVDDVLGQRARQA